VCVYGFLTDTFGLNNKLILDLQHQFSYTNEHRLDTLTHFQKCYLSLKIDIYYRSFKIKTHDRCGKIVTRRNWL